MNKLLVPFEVKGANDKGHFTGYAAVFNNVDRGKDRILPGAFKEFETTKSGHILIALHHDTQRSVAKATFKQDDHGLYVEGDMILDLDDAKQAYIRMKNGLLEGMSIGYSIMSGGAQYIEDEDVYELSALKLWEASIVTNPMNPAATVLGVKNVENERDFEKFLRDSGYSRKEATAITLHGFKGIQRDAESGSEMLLEIKNALEGFSIG